MRLQQIIFLIPVVFILIQITSCSTDRLSKVQEADLSDIDPNLFSEEEWYMPYYLKHFAKVANSVKDTGPDRGFFDLSVWRGSRNHHTYNARIMEGILSLVWFYCTDRPWNIYYNDQNLRKRIEASLEFWCSIQHEDGRFSEYRVGQWSLAPTAFATKFIGRALWLLNEGPGIDADVMEKSREALRKAIYIGFTHEGLWEHGRNYTNQFANLWGGALSYLAVWPDEEIEALFQERLKESMTEFQSPVGFFYEKGGPDWGYNLNTHHSDLQVAWEYADEETRALIIKKTRDWYSWFSYNAVLEPGSTTYFLNRAIESRQRKGFIFTDEEVDPALQRWIPQAEFIPEVHAFEISKEELDASRKRSYQKMLEGYPEVAELEVGEFNAFTPYAFLHQDMKEWHPTKAQKKMAISKLPYNSPSDFVHIRHDDRSATTYTYVKTPGYYACFSAGKIITKQQRYGLGLIWNEKMGTSFQSQSKSDLAAFGTMAASDSSVYESRDLFPSIKHMGKEVEAVDGFTDLEGGLVEINYSLGNQGKKSISFEKDKIKVHVIHPNKFAEYIPLLLSQEDKLTMEDQQISISNPNGEFTISFNGSINIIEEDVASDLETKQCKVIWVSAENALHYEMEFKVK